MDSEQPDAVRKELWDAFDRGDTARVKELFQSSKPHALFQQADDLLDDCLRENRSLDLARCLLDLGGSTAKITSINECRSIDMWRLMVEHGFDLRNQGHILLEDVVDNQEILDYILDQGVDINRPNPRRGTLGTYGSWYIGPEGHRWDNSLGVLNNTAARGDIALFDHLVERGADVTKSIALHHVARCEDPEKMRATMAHLINKYGLDVNAGDNPNGLRTVSTFQSTADDIGTPLNFAVYFRNVAAIEALLEYGADPDPKKEDYPPEGTGKGLWPNIVEDLLGKGLNPTIALDQAVRTNQLELAKLCIEKGADVDKVLELWRGPRYGQRGMSSEMKGLLQGRQQEHLANALLETNIKDV